jgi:hypothetical protein
VVCGRRTCTLSRFHREHVCSNNHYRDRGRHRKFLVTGAPVTTTTAAVLKISFGNDTAGTNLALCAGTIADFVSSHCTLQLSDSGGPGFTFLTIVDTPAIAGKVIFVLRGWESRHRLSR